MSICAQFGVSSLIILHYIILYHIILYHIILHLFYFIKPTKPTVAGVGWVWVAYARPLPVPVQPIPRYP